jgi:hypothetical protein
MARGGEARLSLNCAGAKRTLRIERPDGAWNADGILHVSLIAAVDIDIMAMPFTNSRLAPWPEEPVEMTVAWVMLPTLEVRPVRQSYRRLAARDPPPRLAPA